MATIEMLKEHDFEPGRGFIEYWSPRGVLLQDTEFEAKIPVFFHSCVIYIDNSQVNQQVSVDVYDNIPANWVTSITIGANSKGKIVINHPIWRLIVKLTYSSNSFPASVRVVGIR